MSTPEPKTPDAFSFPVIGVMHSCFMAKFGVPRQPGLIPEATGYIELQPPFNQPNTVRGLEQFSHLWLCFVFHHNLRDGWKATVRPPRLGGDTRLGVFATRSPFRPSPIGLSVVKLQHLELKDHGIIRIHVQGQDLVDGTPIIDIKPYIPYTDAIPDANAGFAADSPSPNALPVSLSPHAEQLFQILERHGLTTLRTLALKVIAADPRPAYQKDPHRTYGVFLNGFEIVWTMDGDHAIVTDVRKAPKN